MRCAKHEIGGDQVAEAGTNRQFFQREHTAMTTLYIRVRTGLACLCARPPGGDDDRDFKLTRHPEKVGNDAGSGMKPMPIRHTEHGNHVMRRMGLVMSLQHPGLGMYLSRWNLVDGKR